MTSTELWTDTTDVDVSKPSSQLWNERRNARAELRGRPSYFGEEFEDLDVVVDQMVTGNIGGAARCRRTGWVTQQSTVREARTKRQTALTDVMSEGGPPRAPSLRRN